MSLLEFFEENGAIRSFCFGKVWYGRLWFLEGITLFRFSKYWHEASHLIPKF